MKVRELFEAKITNEQLVTRWIQEHCPNNFSALMAGRAMPLWRSTHLAGTVVVDQYTAGIMTERTKPRQSQTGNNLIMNYVSVAPAWAKMPIRNTSTSCTPSISTAGDFAGDMCLIIPFDDVKLFAACEGDFNFLDPTGISGGLLEIVGKIMSVGITAKRVDRVRPKIISPEVKKVFDIAKLPAFEHSDEHTYSMEDIEALSDAIEKMIYAIDDLKPKEINDNERLQDLKNSCDDLEDELVTRSVLEFLTEQVTPKMLEVETFSSYPSIKVNKESEIWFNGHYIAITGDHGENQTATLVSSPFLRKLFQKI
jgi:hypothetical protein